MQVGMTFISYYCLADLSDIKRRHSLENKIDSEYNFSVSVENEQDAVTKAQSEDTNASRLRYFVIRYGFRIVLKKKTNVIRYVHFSGNVYS